MRDTLGVMTMPASRTTIVMNAPGFLSREAGALTRAKAARNRLYLVHDEVHRGRLSEHHAGLRQHPLGLLRVAFGASSIVFGRVPVPRALARLCRLVAPDRPHHAGEEGVELTEPSIVQDAVLQARVERPRQLVAGLLSHRRSLKLGQNCQQA